MPAAAQAAAVINDEIHSEFAQAVTDTGFPTYLMRRPRGRRHLPYVRQLFGIIRRHRIRIVHAHNDAAKFWAFACKLRFPYLKIVYTVHGNGDFDRFQPLHLPFHRALVDRTIAISQSVLDECLAAGIQNAVLIHNGIPVGRFATASTLRRPSAVLRLVNVARIDHRIKGQDILIRAVRRCLDAGIDVTCRLIGNASAERPDSLPFLVALVRELHLADRIVVLRDRTDIPGLLQEADVFIFPSRREGFGLVVLEAMAAGLPVIVANVDGPAELVQDGETGLRFEPGSDADLFDKIRSLALDQGKSRRIAGNGRRFVEDFDISRMRDRYFSLYEEVLHGRPARRG
ncbi:MAG: glycosyltransferase family 4 protein [Methylobacteriaceae bacterium]|nr:glycosyltransferase family 4 protein [Methylobacteriaceae bacterium]